MHVLHECLCNGSTPQVTIAGGLGNVHVKRLAYDVCKAVPLSESDGGLLLDGIKVGRLETHAAP